MRRLAPIILAGALALPLHAQITYVDAVEGAAGNTFATGGSLADTSWLALNNGANSIEDRWDRRSVFGNGGVVFQASHFLDNADGDSMPELTTQVPGLADGTYDVWVFFWDVFSSPNNWTISAGLESGSLLTYSFDGLGDQSQTVAASSLDFVVDPMFTESNRTMYAVKIGQTQVVGGSNLNVYIDNLVGGGTNNRVWYDGIGYELVPEIVSPALKGFTYDPSTGDSQVSIEGQTNTAYILVEAQDLDFDTPDQSPVPLTAATVGTLAGDQVITDSNGNATVQFNLGTTKPATFIRAEGAPPLLEENFDATAALPAGWISSGPVNGTVWDVGIPSGVPSGPAAPTSEPHCAGTNIGGYYTENTDVSLTSPSLAIPPGRGATLRFQKLIDTDAAGDAGAVKILDADNADTPISGLWLLGLQGEGTDGDGWTETVLPLPAGSVGGKNIKIRFEFVSDGGTAQGSDVFGGFYIDDVSVTLD